MTPPARTSPYDTRTQPTVSQPEKTTTGSNLSVSTLAVAAAASVVAAVVTSRLWQGGTLISTAMTPVIVAVVKEFLDRPASKITEVSSRAVRRTPGVRPTPADAERFDEPDGVVVQVHEPAPVPRRGGAQLTDDQPSSYRIYGTRRNRWRIAIATGLAAFAVVAAVMTVPELVSGSSLFNNRGTTLWGGTSRHHRSTTTTTTTTTSTTRTVTTTTPTQTVTVPAQTTPTTTVPAQTTPTTTVPTQTAPTQQPAPVAPQSGSTTPGG
jgi:hypothetical protein